MEKLKVGIVGCGLISKLRHIPAYKGLNKKVDLVAVCDLNEQLAKDVAASCKIPRAYSNVTEMLSKENLDIVDICVPPKAHAPVAIEAMEKGCHIIMEKPMAISTSDCDKMISCAKKKNLSLCTIHNDLFHPSFIKAKEMIRKGEIGEFNGMRIFLSTPRTDMIDLENHWYHKLPGGVIGETGPHMAYMSLAFLNDVNKVDLIAKDFLKHPWAPNDFFSILLEGSNGISSTTLSYASGYWAANVDIIGTKACLNVDLETMIVRKHTLDQLSYSKIAKSALRSIGQQTIGLTSNVIKGVSGGLKTGTDTVIKEFIDSILSNGSPPVTPEEGKEVVRIMELIVKEYNLRTVDSN